jgi:hypothetical protein
VSKRATDGSSKKASTITYARRLASGLAIDAMEDTTVAVAHVVCRQLAMDATTKAHDARSVLEAGRAIEPMKFTVPRAEKEGLHRQRPAAESGTGHTCMTAPWRVGRVPSSSPGSMEMQHQ